MAYFDRFRARYSFAVAALAMVAAGCSMHPLPEDVSRASTYDIVARVRCEVYEALQEFKGLEGEERRHAENIIQHSAVGFDFIFNITEGNDIKTPDGPGVKASYQRESFKNKEKGFFLDATGTTERERQNIRRFRVVDDLEALSNERIDCRKAEANPNWVYPVTGATGMGEVVRTYIKLEMLSDLRDRPLEPVDGALPLPVKGNAVTFSDVLRFKTKLSAGINPRITLTTVAGDLRLTGASFFGSASRDDIHTIIVALASDSQDLDTLPSLRKLPPDVRKQVENDREGRLSTKRITEEAKVAIEKDRVARSRAAARSFRRPTNDAVAAAVLRNPRAATALVQYDSDARTNVLLELQRLRDLEDDEFEAPRRLGDRLLKLLREPD